MRQVPENPGEGSPPHSSLIVEFIHQKLEDTQLMGTSDLFIPIVHCFQKLSGLSEVASSALESLLALHLKLSYLSTMTPRALKEYTDSGVRWNMGKSRVSRQHIGNQLHV